MAHLQGNELNGDIAHLVGFSGGGGVAYVDVLCNNRYGFGVSAINNSFSPVPTYSWTVMVIAHEIGHNYGAGHTHDCEWGPTGYGDQPIDCCGPDIGYAGIGCSGTCDAPPFEDGEGGTIMSYCHIANAEFLFIKIP